MSTTEHHKSFKLFNLLILRGKKKIDKGYMLRKKAQYSENVKQYYVFVQVLHFFLYEDVHQKIINNRMVLLMCAGDALGLTASDSYDLAVRSLGAVTW